MGDFRLPRSLRHTVAALSTVTTPVDPRDRALLDAMVRHVELTLATFPLPVLFAAVAGLAFVEASAVARLGWPARFSRLDETARETHFAALWNSPLPPLRTLARSWKALVAYAYWEQPSVREAMGYRPEQWIAQVAAARQARFADDIHAHDRLVVAPDPLVHVQPHAPRSSPEDTSSATVRFAHRPLQGQPPRKSA